MGARRRHPPPTAPPPSVPIERGLPGPPPLDQRLTRLESTVTALMSDILTGVEALTDYVDAIRSAPPQPPPEGGGADAATGDEPRPGSPLAYTTLHETIESMERDIQRVAANASGEV